MKATERARFDELFYRVVDDLPQKLRELLEEVPAIVEDEPDGALLDDLAREALAVTPGATLSELKRELREELCGLHSGPMITERSVLDGAEFPEEIRLYRRGIILTAGGWDQPDADQAVAREIRITLLHEIGHHFGLDEEELEARGFA